MLDAYNKPIGCIYLHLMTPPKQLLSWALLLTLLFSCNSKSATSDTVEDTNDVPALQIPEETAQEFDRWYQIQNYIVQGNIPDDSIQVVDAVGVIVINPTDEQIDKMIREYGEDDFYTVADDNSFYQASAMAQLDSFAVHTVMAEKRYLKLAGNGKTWLIDVRPEGAPEWNMIFFDKTQEPKVMSAIDVTPEELASYFGGR